MKRRKYDKRLSVARKMPPLERSPHGEEYSVNRDRVLDWVKRHTDLPLYLVSLLAQIGYIEFNPDTQKWQGVDYED